MIKIIDIINEVKQQISDIFPDSNHELGNCLENNNNTFCYYFDSSKSKKQERYIQNIITKIKILYYWESVSENVVSLKEKLLIIEKLKKFLNRFCLIVESRRLEFDYDMGEVDECLNIILNIRYLDNVVDLDCNKENGLQEIKQIKLRKED